MQRRLVLVVSLAGLVGLVAGAPATEAADKGAATVAPATPVASWSGSFALPVSAVATTDCDPSDCDTLALTVDLAGGAGDLTVTVDQTGSLTLAQVDVVDGDGTVVAEQSGLNSATAVVEDVAAGTYTVRVHNGSFTPLTTYTAAATLDPAPAPVDPGTLPADTVLRDTDEDAPVASADVPLRVVLVGFEPGSVDAETVLGEIPDRQRVGLLNPHGGTLAVGDDGLPVSSLVNHGRSYYDANEPNLLPLEFRWDPELVYAPLAFAAGLFGAMVEHSQTGDYADPVRRAYLEAYNVRGSTYRLLASGDPGQVVAPSRPVRFVDGEDVEDWIVEHAEEALGFPVGRDPGEPGYTVFVLNTWDVPEAAVFPKGEYHVFRIDRTDPDRGDFDGIDWARVWGGRYRFMMVDAGAAPNPYEAESWGNRGRSALGSALYDPPLWEHRAGAPRPVTAIDLADGLEGLDAALTPGAVWDQAAFEHVLARTVNEAVNYRFFHAYLYEPRPGTGRFFLSDNVWQDRLTLYRSELSRLYHQPDALAGLSSLAPYLSFEGDVRYEYLDEVGAHPEYADDQAALDQAKQDGLDVGGVPHTAMHTRTMMDYIDSRPDRFLRGGACATTVPTIQVAVPLHYAWALPIAAGIATNRGGVPWGFLNSVNDVTKWNGADKDQTLVLAHPNVVYNNAFTYTTIHEASHYLGLAHPHDTVGARRGPDGEPRYFNGFTWTFNTTASPTTYSHVEVAYSILDQESIARGHLAYYLQWANEALEEGGLGYYSEGVDTIPELPADAAALRATAVTAVAEAESLFAGFDFVRATFAAQEAWRAASDYRDLALGQPLGTSEAERGTQIGTDAEAAAACAAAPAAPAPESVQGGIAPRAGAAPSAVPQHVHLPGTPAHTHLAGGTAAALPATGGAAAGGGVPTAAAVALFALALAILRRRLA